MRICLLVFAGLCIPASQAAGQTLTLTPSVVELKGTHAQSTTQTLTITNGTGLDLGFEMQAQDVTVAGGKRVFVTAGDLPNSIAATAVFSRRELTVPAGKSGSVVVTVTVPRSTTCRAIVVLFKGVTRIANGAAVSTVSLGTLMAFTLSDKVSVAPSNLTVVSQSDARNAAFEQAFANDGTEPVVPKGVAVILNGAGAIVGKATFAPQRLLPGERLTFRTEYAGELRAGAYRVLSTFEFAGRATTRTGSLVVR